jgi:hypothetical protein
MPASGVLVNSGVSSTPYAVAARQHTGVFGDGYRWAAYSKGSQTRFSLKSGAGSFALNLSIAAVDIGAVAHAIVQNGTTLYLYSLSGSTLRVQPITYAAGTLTAGTAATYSLSLLDSAVSSWTEIDATYQSTYGAHFIALDAQSDSKTYVASFSLSGATLTKLGSILIAGGANNIALAANGSTATTLHLLFNGNPLVVYPIILSSGSSFVAGAFESAYTGTVGAMAYAYDASGYLDIVFVAPGSGGVSNVYTTKRTGSGIYSQARTLYSNEGFSATEPVTAYDSGADTLFVFIVAKHDISTGEIFLAKRISGTWGSADLLVGGDGDGYLWASANPVAVSSAGEIVYLHSGSELYHLSAGGGAAPDTPTVTAPSGNVGGITPTIAFTYSNLYPTDTQGAYQILVKRSSDDSSFWDSGKVSNTAHSVAYAGTTLVYDTQYYTQVREWDAVLDSPSSYSAAVTFTPRHAPVVAITSVTVSGSTDSSSPVTLTASSFSATLSYANSSGANAVSLTAELIASDGTTVVDSVTRAISPAVAPSGTITLASWSPAGLVNSRTYYLRVAVTDANGISGTTSDWELDSAFTPPSASTDFTATPVNNSGYVQCAWTDDAASYNLYYRVTGDTDWILLENVTGSGRKVFAQPEQPWDYALERVTSDGTASAKATALAVELGPAYGFYSVWLNDPNAPTAYSVCLGGLVDWGQGTRRETMRRKRRRVPLGSRTNVTTSGLQRFRQGSRAFYVGGTAVGSDGSILTAEQVVDALDALEARDQTLVYRDSFRRYLFVTIEAFSDEADAGLNAQVAFQFLEERWLGDTIITAT